MTSVYLIDQLIVFAFVICVIVYEFCGDVLFTFVLFELVNICD